MRITRDDLLAQYQRASKAWPFITAINDSRKLLPCLLYAVGSRETNLRNIVGDGGHGHGMFQLDDRWHAIPAGFDQDVFAQAQRAADMLDGLRSANGTWLAALNAYNSGQTNTAHTANGDYGPDVLERQAILSNIAIGAPPVATFEGVAYGQTSDLIKRLQVGLNRVFPLYSHIAWTSGYYGDQTTAVIKEFQRRSGIDGDGRNVGPRTSKALTDVGIVP